MKHTHRTGLQLSLCIVSQLETLGTMIGVLLVPEELVIDVTRSPPPRFGGKPASTLSPHALSQISAEAARPSQHTPCANKAQNANRGVSTDRMACLMFGLL